MTGSSIEPERAAEEIAGRLGLDVGAPVTRVSFVIEVDRLPVALFEIRTPESVVTLETMRRDFREAIVDFFDGCDGRPRLAWYRMEVREVRADRDIGRSLGVSAGRTLFLFDDELLDGEDNTIGLSTGYFVPDCVRISIDRRAVVHDPEPCNSREKVSGSHGSP